ncbi:MAG: hypothetical protein QM758_10930 [Armatimonas sp.]
MKLHTSLLGLVTLWCVSGAATADSLADTRRALETRYQQMNRAYERKDIASIEKLFSPKSKFKQRSEGLIANKTQFIYGTKGLLASTTIKRSNTKIVKLKPAKGGYEATVVWSGESAMTKDPRTWKNIAPKLRKTEQTMRDMWEKTANGWQITSRLIDD